MRIKDIYKFVFHNKHYTTVKAWYTESMKDLIVWHEFIKRIPQSTLPEDTTEYKEYLYSKRNVLKNIQDLYKKSGSIIRDYSDVILKWKSFHKLSGDMLFTYEDRELLMTKVQELDIIREYKSLEKNYYNGVNSYLYELGKNADSLSLKEIIKLLSEKSIIIDRNDVISKYIEICKKYPFAIRYYINHNDLCISYNEQVKVVQGIKDIQSINKQIQNVKTWYDFYFSNSKNKNFEHFIESKEYKDIEIINSFWEIKTKYEKGLAYYRKEHKGINEHALIYLKQIVNDSRIIVEYDTVLNEFDKLSDFKYAIQIYIGYQTNLQDVSIDAKKDVCKHLNKIRSIQKEIDLANVWFDNEFCSSPNIVQENFKERVKLTKSQEDFNYKYFFYQNKQLFDSLIHIKKTYDEFSKDSKVVEYYELPSSPTWSDIENTVKNIEVIRKRIHVKKEFLDFKSRYKRGLDEYLLSHKEIDTESYDGQILILKRSDEIIELSNELYRLLKYRGNSYKPVLYLFFNKREECDFSIEELRHVEKNSFEFLKLKNSFSHLHDLLSQYPKVGKLWIERNTDNELLSKFSDPLLCCHRDLIKNISISIIKEQFIITDLFLELKDQYPIGYLKLIYLDKDIPEDNDFSNDGISAKKELLVYHDIYSKSTSTKKTKFICDTNDRDCKIRCILQSIDYGKYFSFSDLVPISQIIDLAIFLYRKKQSSNTITCYINQHLQSVLDYNYIHYNCDSVIPEDYQLYSSQDEQFLTWVNANNTLEGQIHNLEQQYKAGFDAISLTIPCTINERSREAYRYMLSKEENIKICYNNWKAKVREEQRKKAELEKRLAEERKQRAREEEYKRQQEALLKRRRKLQHLLNCVSTWYTHTWNGDVKHKWFYNYYSYRDYKDGASSSMWETWKFIWHFKNDPHATVPVHDYEYKEAVDKAVPLVEKLLQDTFSSDVSSLTLVCLTASTREKNELRFKLFADRVCNDLNMYNAYTHIRITSEGGAKHEGGTGVGAKSYDTEWFKEKYVVLFDDVRTSGSSISTEKNILESLGAHVICAITLAQTTN